MNNRLTLLIPCKNELDNLAACIASVGDLPDEVLVADSGSTDGTREAAARLGCRIIERDYGTSGDFKNWAIPQASCEWVLLLDADERATPELVAEIRRTLAQPAQDGYWIYRLNHLMGHPLRHGPWGRDKVLRLFRRDLGRYVGPTDHAEVEVASHETDHLQARLIHYTAWDYRQYLPKVDRYADVQARLWHEEGRQASITQLLARGPLRFLQGYLWQLGFLDGIVGWQVCALVAYQSYLKQARLWELQHARPQRDLEDRPPDSGLQPEPSDHQCSIEREQPTDSMVHEAPGTAAHQAARQPASKWRAWRRKLTPKGLDLQARRQLRNVVLRRFGMARSHRPMLLVRRPELTVANLLRPMVAHELLRERDLTFLQIGAYDGIGDDDLRELVFAHRLRGVLVEPQPAAFARLQRTYANQPQVTLLQAAIDVEPGTRTLYRPASEDAQTASFDREHLVRHGIARQDIVGEEVACHTVASALAAAQLEQVDLLQIDAEGYDDAILASIDFDRLRPNLVRFEFRHLTATRAEACLERLAAHGYRFLVEEKDIIAWRAGDARGARVAA